MPFSQPTPTPSTEHIASTGPSFFALDVVDVAQLAFWITVAAVTVLTYRQARRTVLQPLRTEVFKLQLDVMKDLLAIIASKQEVDLTRHFHLDKVLTMNTWAMLDDYALIAFGLMPPVPDDRPYSPERAAGALVPRDSSAIEPIGLVVDNEGSPPPPPSWDSWSPPMLYLTEEFQAATGELEAILANPLLPKSCATLVEALLQEVHESALCMLSVLADKSTELPSLIPEPKALTRVRVDGLHNDWNARKPGLQPRAEAVVNFARGYFASDELGLGSVPRR